MTQPASVNQILPELESNKLVRTQVIALNEILGIPLQVLDQGFIRVIDYMGDDRAVVQAARVSYGAGTKHIHEDRGLIRYLLRHQHTTPFEMCEIKLHIRVPMDCWRQWIRHRTANVNEYSTRYSVAIDAVQKTNPDQWRLQSTENKQGSAGYMPLTDGQYFTAQETELHQFAEQVYAQRLAAGIAREQARKDLPLATYTEAYWKIDLHNLLHFLALRIDSHAQLEIRQYATVIAEQIMPKWVPLTWEAFQDYRINAMKISALEIEILTLINTGQKNAAVEKAIEFGWLPENYTPGQILKRNRERQEFETKLALLKIDCPW